MRAGLIIGGAFLMFFGTLLLFTILLAPLGLLFGLIGFIMLIVGLVTSSHERVIVSPQTTVYAQPPQPAGMKNCPNCGWSITENARYCAHCGKFLESSGTEPKPPSPPPQEPKVLAICPTCKSRIPSESKFCPECGTDLQPKKQK